MLCEEWTLLDVSSRTDSVGKNKGVDDDADFFKEVLGSLSKREAVSEGASSELAFFESVFW